MTEGSPCADAVQSRINGDHGGLTGNDPSSNPAAFLAPSDFLPGLPPSTNTPTISNAPAGTNEQDGTPSSSTRATIDAHGRTLNPRSCVTCRKRKVKCDKLWPCNNCNRAHIECVFPAPGRAPRKPRKLGEGRDKELLERLRKLESVVKGMGAEVPGGELPEESQEVQADATSPKASPGEATGKRSSIVDHEQPAVVAPRDAEEEFQSKTRWVEEQQKGRFENRFGRLVVNDGKSRYINNSFWANLSNEVEDLKGILNQSSDDEEDHQSISPGSGSNPQAPSNHHAFVFGLSSHNVDLLSLHPLPGQIKDYWNIYKDRVDPLCKILHVPTLEGTILTAASHLTNLSRGFECLLFAIYYGATTSLSAEDCLSKLGEEKAVLLTRYRFAIEQALARANFLTTEEIVVLQAFVIFLICLRRNSDARVIWTLTGLVVRIAQTLGIHRDGTHFGLSPFEVEMRRRLWWQVCILDTRASEDHGCDPTIIEQSFDTKLPLNINDEDMTPDMNEYPPERKGCTIMSFCLLRFEVGSTFRRINYIPPGPPKACNDFYQSVTLEDKERWITECHKRLEERYLKHCDMSVPLFWVTATVARLMMSKMWLMVYHPFQRQDGGASLSEEVKEKLFITSLENMEYSLLLESESRTMKWSWLFRTYIQWHALAFTLSELCHRTTGDMVERAWKAVDRTVDGRWGVQYSDETNTGHLWRPLKKLHRKAKDARAKGLQEEQVLKQTQSNASIRHYSPNANPMFGHPNRASVTRAPLSSAQLQRFHQGPSFGRAPLDKHELLRSPKLGETGQDNAPDVGNTNVDMLNQTWQPEPDTMANTYGNSSALFSSVPLAAPAPQQPYPHGMTFGENYLNSASSISFDDVAIDHLTTTPNTINTQQITSPAANNATRMDSLDSLDNDLSIMDTSGNMDWENWDQLVRQFGMDVDSGAGNVGGGVMDGNGMNFNATAPGDANLKSGFGMSGGEWY
ncbi:hypothetical protein Slin15195_G073160 [Septoria linicola]|uniref:Zn(2)-C6 fungal-type domain-containing protein n=1 Tax=Septoria linicola TaxID=215465 RepID=A0A9Q9AY12_9PEZI|nr:hypothetical protein Slin14017_G105880 [Septoria linicola]USW53997.1 hypothetical protein Slin15195_G073160 [Septoria linicola]